MVRLLFPKQFLEVFNHGQNQNEHRANQAHRENYLQESDRDGDQQGHNRSLAFASWRQSVPYELFTNFLAGSYGVCNPMELDGYGSIPSEDGFGYGCSNFCCDHNSGGDFSSLLRDCVAA